MRNRTRQVTVMMKYCDVINSPFNEFPHSAVYIVQGAKKVVPAKSAKLVSTLLFFGVCVCVKLICFLALN